MDDCVPLVVEFDSLSARQTPRGVMLQWTTNVEVDTSGFRILRETTGSREKATQYVSPMIHAAGNGLTGASYQFLDNSAPTGGGIQ